MTEIRYRRCGLPLITLASLMFLTGCDDQSDQTSRVDAGAVDGVWYYEENIITDPVEIRLRSEPRVLKCLGLTYDVEEVVFGTDCIALMTKTEFLKPEHPDYPRPSYCLYLLRVLSENRISLEVEGEQPLPLKRK